MTAPSTRPPAGFPFLPLGVCLLATALANAAFALQQTLWLDETTQLSGLSLGPIDVTRWLMGADMQARFGCPTAPDRMPPVSYWAQWLWSLLFGTTELSYRFSGVCFVTLAALLVFVIARRAYGTGSAVVATLLLGLSPAIIERAPEIRAYPFYLLAAALVYYCLARFLERRRQTWLIALCLALLLTIYTHFLGVIFAGVLFLALLIVCQRRLAVFLAGSATAAACAGLIPFIVKSRDVSKYGYQWPLQDRLLAAAETLWHLLGQHITSYHWVCMPLILAALLLLIRALWRARGALAPLPQCLLLILALGLAVVTAASFGITAFKPALFQYNLWLVPAVVLLIASLTQSAVSPARDLARLAAALLLVATVIGTVRTAAWGTMMIHGPHPRLIADIRACGPRNVTLIHERYSDPAAVQVFYPIAYVFHGQVHQVTWYESLFATWDHRDEPLRPELAATRFVIVVRAHFIDLPDVLAPNDDPFPAADAVQQLSTSGRWRLAATYTTVGMMRQTVWIFERLP